MKYRGYTIFTEEVYDPVPAYVSFVFENPITTSNYLYDTKEHRIKNEALKDAKKYTDSLEDDGA